MTISLQHFLALDALATGIFSLALGLIVLAKDRKNIVNWMLFILNSDVALWLISYWRWLSIYDNASEALFWTRMLTVGSTLIPVFFLHWVLSVLGLNNKRKWIIAGAYLVTAGFLAFCFTPLMVRTVEPIQHFAFWPKAGPLYAYYLAFCFVGIFAVAIYYLIANYKNSSGNRRNQIKYILAAIMAAIIGGATNFPLWYDIKILPVGNILIVVFSLLITLAVIKHRLMDIKFILRQSTVYVFSLATVVGLAVLVEFTAIKLIGWPAWADAILIIFAILAFNPIRARYYRLANQYFFSSLYDSRQLISTLNDKLRSTIELNKLFDSVSDILISTFRVKAFGVLTYQAGNYVATYNNGFAVTGKPSFPGNKTLYNLFTNKSQPIILEEVRKSNLMGSEPTLEIMDKLNVALLAPLNIKDKTVGLMVFGPKESGEAFNDEDLKVLEIIGGQMAFALENATLYQESVEQKNKITALIANFIDPILFMDKAGKLSLLNPAAQKILGIQKESLGAEICPTCDASGFSMDKFKPLVKSEFAVKTAKELKSADPNEEEVTVKPGKDELIYRVNTVPVVDEKGQFLGIMKVFNDLTREKKVDKLKSEFITVAAHQLRTPLSGLKWALGMLREGDMGKLAPEQQAVIEKSFDSNERMILVVNDLLNVARIEEGKYNFHFAPAHIEECLDEAVTLVQPMIQKRQIVFEYKKAPTPLPEMMLDKEKIAAAVQNLLENAVKYTLPGGRVTLELKNDNANAEVSVTDTGVGIPKDQQDRLFVKFFRGTNVMKMETDGSGFGLYISKNIVTAHGGRIWAESEEGKGSVFHFSLPFKNPNLNPNN